ncbi:hypothetical protein DINM_004163 [Dirofilaria immitis]|nr:hypothetical protein [Dirofilaria immitis]
MNNSPRHATDLQEIQPREKRVDKCAQGSHPITQLSATDIHLEPISTPFFGSMPAIVHRYTAPLGILQHNIGSSCSREGAQCSPAHLTLSIQTKREAKRYGRLCSNSSIQRDGRSLTKGSNGPRKARWMYVHHRPFLRWEPIGSIGLSPPTAIFSREVTCRWNAYDSEEQCVAVLQKSVMHSDYSGAISSLAGAISRIIGGQEFLGNSERSTVDLPWSRPNSAHSISLENTHWLRPTPSCNIFCLHFQRTFLNHKPLHDANMFL